MFRTCIFVDGENFRHSVCDLFEGEFDKRQQLPRNARWAELFDWLVEKATDEEGQRVRTYWYVVQHLDFYPYRLARLRNDREALKKVLSEYEPYSQELEQLSGEQLERRMRTITDELEKKQERMRARFRGWNELYDGIAMKHEAVEFRRAGAITYRLFDGRMGREKGVDVKLAADLIVLSDIYDVAVILSGDQDYVPAVQVVKDRGKKLVNVAFRTRDGKLLPGGARRLNQKTDYSLQVSYEELKSYLNLGRPPRG